MFAITDTSYLRIIYFDVHRRVTAVVPYFLNLNDEYPGFYMDRGFDCDCSN